MKRNFAKIISLLLAILMLTACSEFENIEQTVSKEKETTTQYTEIAQSESVSEVEPYTVYPYTVINNNIPEFEKTDYTKSFEKYGELDSLGRCTSCIANIGTDLMPTEERGAIGSVKPTGWQVAKYSNVDGRYLYNRCHLIGYQLSAENANPNNLITAHDTSTLRECCRLKAKLQPMSKPQATMFYTELLRFSRMTNLLHEAYRWKHTALRMTAKALSSMLDRKSVV